MILRHKVIRLKEKLLIYFWYKVPNKCLYWAVNSAWAKASTLRYANKTPDEINWEMVQRYLSE